MKRGLFLAMVLAMSLLCLTACGGNNVAGTYKFYSMKVNGIVYKAGDTIMGLMPLHEDLIVVELHKDGTATATSELSETEEGAELTWEMSDGKIVIHNVNDDSVEMTFTVDGDTLIGENEGQTFTLKKV